MRTRGRKRALLLLPLLAGAGFGHVIGAAAPAEAVTFRPSSAATIPGDYLALYRASAGTCAGLRWEALAAVGRIESDHGRSTAAGVRSGENRSGAAGPMQFLAATWRQWGTSDPNDRYAPAAAIPAAARYLCSLGIGSSELRAFSNYYAGPAAKGAARAQGDAYAAQVERQAQYYAQTAGGAATATGGSSGSGGASGGNGGGSYRPGTTVPSRPPTAAKRPPATRSSRSGRGGGNPLG